MKGVLDNHKRPVSELFLTVINKGYTGYFNLPKNGVGLKQGWKFNLTSSSNSWWDYYNLKSYTNIQTSSYTRTSGATKTFYYNQNLMSGDTMDGDFCEWNDYEQIERVISPYYQKINYNQNVFQTTNIYSTNTPGYYYKPHTSMTIRVFSDYVDSANEKKIYEILKKLNQNIDLNEEMDLEELIEEYDENHEIRIEVGYGLEGSITDSQASFIIRNTLTPAFRPRISPLHWFCRRRRICASSARCAWRTPAPPVPPRSSRG